MIGPSEQGHVRIVARQIVNKLVSFPLQPKRSRRFGNYPSSDRYTDLTLSWRNRDRMIRARNSDLLVFIRARTHFASLVVS